MNVDTLAAMVTRHAQYPLLHSLASLIHVNRRGVSRLSTPNGAAGCIGDHTQPRWQMQRLRIGGSAQIVNFGF